MRTLTEDDLPLQSAYRWERERANREFLIQPYDGGKVRTWTWAQAMGEARRMAAWMKAQNWEPGSRVAILSKNCAWWIMADLATWMAGHVSVPIYPSLKAQSVRYILDHCGAAACFVGATDDHEAPALGIPGNMPVIAFPTAGATDYPAWSTVIAGVEPLADSPVRPAGDMATIIYTSGTTGLPKGVMHSFTALAFDARGLAELLRLQAEDRSFSYLPLAHIVERIGVEQIAFRLGSRIYFTEGLETFLPDLRRARPTLFLAVPRILLKFQQGVFEHIPKEKLDHLLHIPIVSHVVKKRVLRELGLDTVRLAACGAAPLPQEIMSWYRGLGLELAEGYGLTEALITHLPAPGAVRVGYVGPAIPGVETRVGEDDELQIRSPMGMMGYYRDPEATRNGFTEDGFYRTGDVVVIAPDGQTKITGRIKEQFKTSKGKYVAPAPIESMLTAHPSVESCCLMGAGMPSPFAICLLTADAKAKCADPVQRKALENSLRQRMEDVNKELDPHERVRFLAIVDGPWTVGNGLITPTLKVKRAAMEQMYQPLVDLWKTQDSPIIWETAA